MVNTIVADGAGTQGTPIVRAAADGGVWVFFWQNSQKPMIQRLTANGDRVFAGNGIQLANRLNTASFTSDMRVDAAGIAYASFDDNSSGTTATTVQKILPDGTLPWAAAGIQMPASSTSFSTRVAPCADGTIVCVYAGSTTSLTLQRINPDGSLVPGENWSINEASRGLSPSDLIPGASGGDVILMWVRGETTSFSSRKGLKIQKFNATHVAQWNGGVPLDVYTSNATPNRSIQSGYFPILVPDGTGGAIAAWYETGGGRNAWLQHVTAAGVFKFAQDGLGMGVAAPVELRLSAAVAFDQGSGEYVVAYERANSNQSLFGLGAQRVNSAGALQWGTGLSVLPIASNHKSFIAARPAPSNSTVISWLDYQGANFPMLVDAVRLDNTGTNVWGSILGVCTSPTTKGRHSLTSTIGADMMVSVWSDDGAGTTDTKAQNINMNGTLGAAPCYADFNGDGGIDGADVEAFFVIWADGGDAADVNKDGGVNGADVETFFIAWEAGACPT